jgi:hypothetical protein
MTPSEVTREMREYAEHLRHEPIADPLRRWADALEQAMREPVGHRGEYGGVLNERGVALPLDTKLYALPPDAAGEIERLDGLCVQVIDLMKKKDAEIERLKKLLARWRNCWEDGASESWCNPHGSGLIDATDAALAKEDKTNG